RGRRSGAGCRLESDHGLQGEGHLPLRVDAQLDLAAHALRHRRLARGLGSSSGELGHNLMDHHFRLGASGNIEGMEDKYDYGRRPTGFYIPRYRNLFGEKRNYLRGFGYQGSASRDSWSRAVAELGIGGAFKDAAAEPGPWKIGGTAFGEMLPNHENKVGIDQTKKDKWGLPVLTIDCATGENE